MHEPDYRPKDSVPASPPRTPEIDITDGSLPDADFALSPPDDDAPHDAGRESDESS